MSLLPSECPNCGHLHSGHDFNAEPGPVQQQSDKYLRVLRFWHQICQRRGDKLDKARAILLGNGGDRSEQDTLKELWALLLPEERLDGTEEKTDNG
jgi:hypothetical protein